MAAEDSRAPERAPGRFDPSRESPPARGRFASGTALRCPTCGLTLHAATIQHEHALVFASCCPRCDGPLPPIVASDRPLDASRDPSIYLG
jgi:uncharacterized paraquat-inducible protein A